VKGLLIVVFAAAQSSAVYARRGYLSRPGLPDQDGKTTRFAPTWPAGDYYQPRPPRIVEQVAPERIRKCSRTGSKIERRKSFLTTENQDTQPETCSTFI